MRRPLRQLLQLPLRLGLIHPLLIRAKAGFPRLSNNRTTTNAATGDVIGTVIVPARRYPQLSPSTITTSAATGDTIGTIRT